MEEITYLYSVRPKRPITGLSGVSTIRTPKSLYLTKEDVAICLQKATVYRCFSSNLIKQVTVDTIDRMHQATYVGDDQLKADAIKKASEGHGKVNAVPVEEEDEVTVLSDDDDPEVPVEKVPVEVEEEAPVVEEEEEVTVLSDDDDPEVPVEKVPVEE